MANCIRCQKLATDYAANTVELVIATVAQDPWPERQVRYPLNLDFVPGGAFCQLIRHWRRSEIRM
jgi:hypothetical protein